LGLNSREIFSILQILRNSVTSHNPELLSRLRENANLGLKVSIPFFSFGLQGIVFAVFRDVSEKEEGIVLSALMQFGQTLADECASLRTKRFNKNFDIGKSEAALAKELIYLLSPVGNIVVKKNGNSFGYKLAVESNYWARYEEINPIEYNEISEYRGFSFNFSNNVLFMFNLY
jgi:hypothetical protein